MKIIKCCVHLDYGYFKFALNTFNLFGYSDCLVKIIVLLISQYIANA